MTRHLYDWSNDCGCGHGRHCPTARTQRHQRNIQIRELREQGLTLEAIGDRFNLTRTRVGQICSQPYDELDELKALRKQTSDLARQNRRMRRRINALEHRINTQHQL